MIGRRALLIGAALGAGAFAGGFAASLWRRGKTSAQPARARSGPHGMPPAAG